MLLPFEEFYQPDPANEASPASAAAPEHRKEKPSAALDVTAAPVGIPATLGELLAVLDADPSTHRDHAQTRSAIRQIGVVLQRPLCDIPTSPPALRQLLATALPAAAPMTQARWSRCVGLMMKALAAYYPDLMRRRQVGGHSGAWKRWLGGLPTKQLKNGLSRFASHCTRIGVGPDEVKLQAFESYQAALETLSLQKNPVYDYRLAVSLWNKAVAGMPDRADRAIHLEPSDHFYSLAWEAFPESFRDDVERFLTHERNPDIFADNYRRQPKESTVGGWRREIRQVASLLVTTGYPIEKITSLAVLVERANAEAALRAQQARQSRNSVSLGSQAATMALIAKYWVGDEKRGKALRDVAKRISPKRKGMTEKNRARLRQFDLKANKLALLRLPAKVFAELARSDTGSAEEARRAMYALAVAIEIVTAIRAQNLTNLEHNRHFRTLRRGRERMRLLVIPACEIKNGEDFEMRLADEKIRLIDTFIGIYRPRICQVPSPYLFANTAGKPRCSVAFTQMICDFIRRETGLIMNIHLFRQFAGKVHLDEHPSDIETVRRVLRHRNTETTLRHYAEQKTATAFERYGKTVAELKVDAVDLALRRPVRKSQGCKADGWIT